MTSSESNRNSKPLY